MSNKMKSPKKYCCEVINGTHQCSNQACKKSTKCASHGGNDVRQILFPWVWRDDGAIVERVEESPSMQNDIQATLLLIWHDYVNDPDYPITSLEERFEVDQSTGIPQLVVTLPKKDNHYIWIYGDYKLEDGKQQFNVEVVPQ